MKTESVAQNSLFRAAFVTAVILMIPLIAMQFTNEVDWDETDFIIMGVLLFITGFVLDQINKRAGKNKMLIGIGVALAFLFIWAHLAVGIVDDWPLAGS